MKILIVSHNPMTTHNNMGKTIATLFRSFSQEELCHLYVYPTIPDIDKCSSYFRITDKDVLKSFYRLKVHGRVIHKSEIDPQKHELFENERDEAVYRNKKNKGPFRVLLRDMMWKLSRWYTKELRTWLKEQRPTHIFLAPGTAKFIYDVARKIAGELHIPIITYICDDYYFVKPADTALGIFQQRLLKRKIEKTMLCTSQIITICKELELLYGEKFNRPTTTVMTGSDIEIAEYPKACDNPQSIVYMGNVRCNRYLSLLEIGRAIDAINDTDGTDYSLEIYSGEKDPVILETLRQAKSIKFCGFVSGEKFRQVFGAADILLHTEAFDEDSIDLVKHSVSTKIADSLSSGICLFAYAPGCVASMNYLVRNNCAMTCTDKKDLKNQLHVVFGDKKAREAVVNAALTLAKKNHDGISVGNEIKRIISEV